MSILTFLISLNLYLQKSLFDLGGTADKLNGPDLARA